MTDTIPLAAPNCPACSGTLSAMPPECCPPSFRNPVRHGPVRAPATGERWNERIQAQTSGAKNRVGERHRRACSETIDQSLIVNHQRDFQLHVYRVAQLIDHSDDVCGLALLDEFHRRNSTQELLSREQPEPRFLRLIEICELLNDVLEIQKRPLRVSGMLSPISAFDSKSNTYIQRTLVGARAANLEQPIDQGGVHFFESRAERQQRDRLNRVQPVSTMKVAAYSVPEHARIEALPRHFGRHMLTVERRIYDFTSQFASAYSGGCWRFFELDNGGFYMTPPDDSYEIRIDSNGFQGRMSADAAGVAVCLFTFSQLSFEHTTDVFAKHFHWLRDFAVDHPEASVIFQAID